MKTITKLIMSAMVAGSCFLAVSAQEINPITQAMLDGYEQILQQNPNDYFTLYQRSAQYYRLSRYDLALNDIKKAISCTPAKDKDMLATEYQLAADIYIQTQEYPLALEAVEAALALTPDSYPLLYQKGNICLYLNKLDEAKAAFVRMQRLQSRSQEAFFGMARVAILQGDNQQAIALMNEAEKLDPTNYVTYCRLGDLDTEMKDYDRAATNYLSALGLANDMERPMASLIELSDKDYQAVANAIEYALTKSDNKVPLYFLKGNIALQRERLGDAYIAFENLLQLPDGQTAEIYAAQADVCHKLGNRKEALDAASKAVILSPTAHNLALKSRIERNADMSEQAQTDAIMAFNTDPSNAEAALEKAYAYLDCRNPQSALEVVDALVEANPDNLDALMLRAYINNRVVSNPTAAVSDYMRVARIAPQNVKETAYKALAQTLTGKKLDGDDTINKLAEEGKDNADAQYWVAVYHAQTGDLEKAVEALARAQQLGYENDFNIWENKDANLNVDPIRYMMNKE